MRDDVMIIIRVAVWILVVVTFMLWMTGCTTYHSQIGPWSKPETQGRMGMPARRDSDWTKLGMCHWGPTKSYPTMGENTCI